MLPEAMNVQNDIGAPAQSKRQETAPPHVRQKKTMTNKHERVERTNDQGVLRNVIFNFVFVFVWCVHYYVSCMWYLFVGFGVKESEEKRGAVFACGKQ